MDDKIKPFFLPQKINNITEQISVAFEEDIQFLIKHSIKIKKQDLWGYEYIYRTEDFINLDGKEFRNFRKLVNKFKNNYKFNVKDNYPKEKVIEFLNYWHEQKSLNLKEKEDITKKSFDEDLKACIHELDLLNKIPCEQIYIEVEKKLIAFCIFLKLNEKLWVALMQKVDYNYKGVDRFLYTLKAEKMKSIEYFTTGASAQDPSLTAFKESLRPCKKIPLYVIEMKL